MFLPVFDLKCCLLLCPARIWSHHTCDINVMCTYTYTFTQRKRMFSLNSRTWLRGLSRRQDSIFSIRRTFSSSASRDFDYDLAVIGGGSGGLAAAKEAMAVDPSLKVVCFDFVSPTSHNTKWGLGGTCVNVGCIPKKLMHYSSHLGHEAMKDAKEYGWKFPQGEITHDWGTMSSTITDYVRSLNFSYRMGLTGAGVKYLNAKAHMKDANTIAFRDSRGKEGEISADKVILAVGGRPYVTENTPGHELCMTSDDIFWDKRPEGPGKTLVIGGGYIAMECAGFLHGLGYDTTIMVRSQVMRQFDDQAGSMVAEMMERDGVRFLQQTSHKSFRVRDENKPVLPEGARKVSEHTYAHASPGDHDSLDGDDVLYQLPFGKSDDGEFVYHQLNRKKLRMEKYQHPSGVIETRTYFTTNMNIANLNAGADSGVGDGDGERSNGEYSSTYKVPAGPIIAKYAAEDGREVEEEFDTVLMAIGRAACVEGLGLDHPSVNVQLSNNKVLVDDYEKTTIDNIYCIGDAAVGIPSHAITSSSSDASSSSSVVPKDRPELTPVAIQAGQLLARRLFGADELTMDYSSIPTTVFTPNEYAFIGLTEDEARAQARKDSDRDNANGGDSNNKEDSDHIEVYWSRFGNLEISPTHVAATDLDKARSSHFSGFRSYARRYTREKKTWWEGVNFEVEDQVCIYPQRDGQVAEALEAAGIQLCSEGPEDDGDTSVKGNDDDSDDRGDNHMMLGKVMKRYQDDEGQWLYDVEVGVDFEPESNSDNSDTEHTSTPDHEHEHEHEHGLIELSCLSDTVLEHEDQTGKDLDELWKKANCLAKLVVDKRSDQVLGIHFVGPNAGEVMQGYSLAFALGKRLATKRNNNDGDNLGGVGLTKTDFDHLIGIHPTAAEEFTVLTVKQSDVESTFLKKAGCGGGSCG